jgi:hypothetical protein
MQRLFHSWVIWLLLEAISLKLAAVSLPTGPCPSQSSPITPTFTHSYPVSSDEFFRETSSVSAEISLRSARQSKQASALIRPVLAFSHVQERGAHFRPAVGPVLSPAPFFFPRKLSPPSTEDEPLLS